MNRLPKTRPDRIGKDIGWTGYLYRGGQDVFFTVLNYVMMTEFLLGLLGIVIIGWAGYLYRFGQAVFSAVFLTSAAVQYDIKIKD